MLVKTTNGREYKILKEISVVLPKEVSRDVEEKFELPADFGKKVQGLMSRKISEDEIMDTLAECEVLVLELTQQCNLRCGYCIFSGNYEYYRSHNTKVMETRTAEKAIDTFYDLVLSPNQRERFPYRVISYYGGESLLEWKALLHSVKYALGHSKANQLDITFNMTTNATLLTPEKVDTLVKFGFQIDISLDGPKNENDRFRNFTNGKGTFHDIMKNVSYIYKNYPDYYKRNVQFAVTLHPDHDLKQIEKFFLENSALFNENNVRINDLKGSNLTHENWLEGRKTLNRKKFNTLRKDGWFCRKVFNYPVESVIKDRGTIFLAFKDNFTRTCFPGGSKLFVDTEGVFHICEKMNRYFPMGSVYDGLNIPKIKEFFEQWRTLILEQKCWECNYLNFCPFCYATAGREGKFVLEKEECKRLEETALYEKFYYYLRLKELEIENISINHNSNLCDFLERLQ